MKESPEDKVRQFLKYEAKEALHLADELKKRPTVQDMVDASAYLKECVDLLEEVGSAL